MSAQIHYLPNRNWPYAGRTYAPPFDCKDRDFCWAKGACQGGPACSAYDKDDEPLPIPTALRLLAGYCLVLVLVVAVSIVW